jgi:hypothetical protein
MAGTAHAVPAFLRADVEILAARRRARGHDALALDRVHSSRKARRFFGLTPVGQGALWSAPVNPPEGRRVASIRLKQSPLRRDQISVKLSSAPWRSPVRRIDSCASIVFMTLKLRVGFRGSSVEGAPTRRCRDAKSCAVVRKVAPHLPLMRERKSFCDRRHCVLVW